MKRVKQQVERGYLAIERAAKQWITPLKDWKMTMNRFATEFKKSMLG